MQSHMDDDSAGKSVAIGALGKTNHRPSLRSSPTMKAAYQLVLQSPKKVFWRALLVTFGALPGTTLAQSGDQMRAIQNIFDPLSKPAGLINDTARLTLLVCLIIFVIVGGLLLFSVVRFRGGRED